MVWNVLLAKQLTALQMRKITMEMYKAAPNRYELRSGAEEGAPACPYGNTYQWVGYDKELQEYVRFTKSVFKLLVNQ
jgi:hypothetical protein